ncbi:MAG: GSU2204 family CXXCH-containing (seleno)protein [Vicinamibacterales bacterium]
MKHTVPLVAAFLLMPLGVWAQQATPAAGRPVEGVVTVGGTAADTTGSLIRVGEYEVLDDALANVGVMLWGEQGTSRFDLSLTHSGDARRQSYQADVNLNRRLTATVSYDRLPHRLDHDPLTWMSAASNIGGGPFAVYATDNDPGAAYALTRSVLASRVAYTAPLPAGATLQLFVGHRQEWRDGVHQVLTTSHCEACHTQSYSRELDQSTRDLFAGTRLQAGRLTVDYTFQNRRFTEDAAGVTTLYDRAIHPAARSEVFYNRVSYDERDGLLPIDSVPGLEKTSHVLKARLGIARDASLSGTWTASTARNLETELGTVYRGLSSRLTIPLTPKATVRGSFRRYDIETDSVFVDVAEPVAPGGPSAGKTYAEFFPALAPVDFVRNSSLNRTPTYADVELIYRPYKRTTVRAGYAFEGITRDYFEIERTTTNTLALSGRGMPAKRLSWQAKATVDWITDPFANHRGAIPAILQPYMSPGNVPFTGLQYFEMYEARQADLTSAPTRRARIEGAATWSPTPRLSVTGLYRFRDAQNDTLEFGAWSQTMHAPGAQVWFAPTDRAMVHAGYIYQRERTETLFSTLAFNG